jgi:hypothetical protein
MSRRKHKPRTPEEIAMDRAKERAEARERNRLLEFGVNTDVLTLPQNADVVVTMDRDKRAKVQTARRISGIDWLYRKGRVSERQHMAGCRYADDYHLANDVSVRSCLNDSVRGGDLDRIQEIRSAAAERLQDARCALGAHVEMTALCNTVLGEGLTIRSMTTGSDDEVARKEATLCVALDLLTSHYGMV